jgi:cyanate permease
MDIKIKNRSVYHWLIVAACCGLAISSIGIVTNCMGVFYKPVSEALGVGRGSVALFNTIVHLSTGFATPVVANLMRKGPQKPILLAGALLITAGVSLLSTANNIWVFYVVAPFVGIGAAATSSVAILAILNNWFDLKYGMASGLALACSGVGGALLAPTFASIIEVIGWRMAFLAAGGVAALASVPGILFIIRKTPQEKGYLPYGGTGEKTVPDDAPKKENSHSLKELLSFSFAAICLMGFLSAGMTSVNSHLPGYADELGFSASIGALMVTCCMIGNISSKLLLGVLCDTLGAVKGCLIMFGSVITAIIIFLFAPADNYWIPPVAAVLFGAVFSLGGIGQSQMIRLVYGAEKFASVYAFASVFPYIGTAIMNTTFGYIYDFSGSYRGALMLSLCMAITALLIMMILTYKKNND